MFFHKRCFMMLNYDMLHTQPAKCQAFTSFTPTECMILLLECDLAWSLSEVAPLLDARNGERAPGGGRKAKLRRIEEKFLFILVYCKRYPWQTV